MSKPPQSIVSHVAAMDIAPKFSLIYSFLILFNLGTFNSANFIFISSFLFNAQHSEFHTSFVVLRQFYKTSHLPLTVPFHRTKLFPLFLVTSLSHI